MSTPPDLDEDVVAQLIRDVGHETALELCRLFADDAHRRIGHIVAMSAADDIEGMIVHAHSLKGLALTYGTTSLADRSLQLEMSCKKGDAPAAHRQVAAIERHIAPSLQRLFDYLEAGGAST